MYILRHLLMAGRWPQVLLVIAVVWIVVMIMGIWPMMCSSAATVEVWDVKPVKERLEHAYSQLNSVKRQNEELKNLFNDINIKELTKNQKIDLLKQIGESVNKAIDSNNEFSQSSVTKSWRQDIDQKTNPSIEYEMVRRRVETNMQEFWNFVHAEVFKAQSLDKSENPELVKVLQNVLNLGVEHKRSLLTDMQTLKEVDGYDKWRDNEAFALSDLVQRRLHALQNPADCPTAKKLVCNLNKGCGYGCQLHHVVYCLILAYATERTLILRSAGWRYHRAGWEQIFLPISETCTSLEGDTKDAWPGKWYTQVITLPIIDALSPRPAFLPLTIPSDIAPRLQKLHGAPSAWWAGQFLKYLLRPQPATRAFLENSARKLGFKRPIVGVHIRRTDKVGTEAAFHRLEEYMNHVEEYYNQLETVEPVSKRRIYLASDDPKVIIEAREKYPSYEVIGDPTVAKTAAVSTRYSDNSLNGIILDIHLLSLSDYLVCTFSSQVCRVAYEIMQSLHVDASERFKSLDDIYYYGGQNPHNRVAVLPHNPKQRPQEMQMKVGDVIGIAGNHWNGYSKGSNRRTNQVGLFPSFKTKDKVDIADFPAYTNVPLVRP
ncbi:alpha-(1,6)-fucosyltransferase 8 [Arctopsyche grandis]|uniref:alpha-(1,6)-fucosyltransferase 8 n=1 Tax=Arctopsyche grandis TaxID=121162 RepID=UPI00406D8800